MTEKNGGGNLTVAIIIALIVGIVVYFLIDAKPVGEVHAPTTMSSGMVTTGSVTGS